VSAPPDLRARVARELTRERPLRPPAVRALALVPIAAAIVVAIPALHVFRPDLRAIGIVRAWGFSIGQAVAGLVIMAAALRESVPGRALSRAAAGAILAAGLVVPPALLALTATRFDIGCFRASATAALPALMAAAFLAARALPMRPSVAGALYGLGAGLMADAGLRLYCDYTQPEHLILAHGGAIAASVAAGIGLAYLSRR
jgi:Negative regulator of sigma F